MKVKQYKRIESDGYHHSRRLDRKDLSKEQTLEQSKGREEAPEIAQKSSSLKPTSLPGEQVLSSLNPSRIPSFKYFFSVVSSVFSSLLDQSHKYTEIICCYLSHLKKKKKKPLMTLTHPPASIHFTVPFFQQTSF